MPRNDIIRLHHILDSAREALSFIQNRSREDLDKDRMLSLSLVRLLEIIGEAARGISHEMRDAYPEIPWRKISGMRDRLVHGYFDVNLNVVWRTVSQELPSLLDKIGEMIDLEENKG